MPKIAKTFNITPDLMARLRDVAEQTDDPMSRHVRVALTKYLETKEKELRASAGSQKISSA